MPLQDPHKRQGYASGYILLAVVATVLAILSQTWWAIAQDKQLTLASEKEHGQVAVRLLEEHAQLTLREASRNLDGVVKSIQAAQTRGQVSDATIRGVLTKAQSFTKVLKSLQFVNPRGQAYVSSIDYPAYQTDADDRTYIPFLLQNTDHTDPVIGKPFKRFYDGELVVPLARNIYTSTGQYLGILSTDVSVSYFSGVYARVAADSNALVALFADAGFLIVRSPFDEAQMGMDITESKVFHTLKSSASSSVSKSPLAEGTFEDTHFLDEKKAIPRIYIYRKIEGFPITTVFAREQSTVLANWRARSTDRILFSGVTVLFVSALTFLLIQHINKLGRSQDSLREVDAFLRRSEQKFSSMFRHSPVPLALVRLDNHQMVEINESWSAQFGFASNEVIGRTAHEVRLWVYPDERAPYFAALQSEGKLDSLETPLRHKDGSILLCRMSGRVVDFNGQSLALLSPIDVTRQRATEHEIRELNIELEARVQQRTQTLEEANTELNQALASLRSMQGELLRSEKMAALGSIVAGVAHELNTPIGIGVTIASTMQDHTQTLVNEIHAPRPRKSLIESSLLACNEGAEVLVRTLMRAAELVRSFKQVAVDQSSDKRRAFDLSTMLKELLTTLVPLYNKTPYTLTTDLAPDIAMESYPGALGQVLTNLISNSLSHGFEGRAQGTMHLRTRTLNEGWVELVFSDDGVGIPEQHRDKVFDPFFTTKLGRGGSGLGMHIVYNLVTNVLGGHIELLKNKLDAASAAPHADVGASIRMTFPQCPAVQQGVG
ncbi:ATP-binding protein [Rhodoferax aquaticus]|uniref:histidine kinase n=1 Tax=Rhodoferax aquaticus TaxID=2527691 RepID=A0A515EQY3_9BURK|nr:ATP-binding protein [Rhodoferax aquaticus]QDL55069.1 PAS domain S-box protein [Rhodoferax aquaticus]